MCQKVWVGNLNLGSGEEKQRELYAFPLLHNYSQLSTTMMSLKVDKNLLCFEIFLTPLRKLVNNRVHIRAQHARGELIFARI